MSLETLEQFFGCKFERDHGEVLPPVMGCKNSQNSCDVEIEWVGLNLEEETNGSDT